MVPQRLSTTKRRSTGCAAYWPRILQRSPFRPITRINSAPPIGIITMTPPGRTSSSDSLLLAEHVFVCSADGHLVFMDLRQDRYFCLNRRTSLLLQSIVIASKSRDRAESPASTKDKALIIRALADRGILASIDSSGKPLEFTQHRLPERSLGRPSSAVTNTLNWRFGRSFLWASLLTSYQLRRASIETTVRTVVQRRTRGTDVQAEVPLVDLVHVFLLLRPFYPREYLCLFDSLCLIHFLAQFRHFPRWIFGVKLEPFGAHCWIQDDDTVLNDTVEVVRQYTPVLVV